MAHHGSTPRSVLDAPSPTVITWVTPLGATRQERRHGVMLPPGLSEVEAAFYLRRLRRNRNQPAIRADYRRGRKVRRHAREQA